MSQKIMKSDVKNEVFKQVNQPAILYFDVLITAIMNKKKIVNLMKNKLFIISTK